MTNRIGCLALVALAVVLSACPPSHSTTDDGGEVDAGDTTHDAGSSEVTDAGSTAATDSGTSIIDAGGAVVDAGSGTKSDAGSQPANGLFHGYIEASALTVVTGGSLTFSGVPVGGTPPYTFAWTIGFIPFQDTLTGQGPHVVEFVNAGGGTREVRLTITDSTGESWSQKLIVMISTTAVGGLPLTITEPASGAGEVGQGGTLEIRGSGAQTWVTFPGSLSLNAAQLGNLNADELVFPWVGTFNPIIIGGSAPLANTGTISAAITVLPEPAGSLTDGLRIGPLQGVEGCLVCNAYEDKRIAVRMAGNGAGKYIAAFDQKMKAVDADDSIVVSLYDGASWSPFVDVDASSSKKVSDVSLGEGNPEYQHHLSVAMAPNGAAAVVFMQQLDAIGSTKSNVQAHVWANVYHAGAWSGAVRLGQETDSYGNRTKAPQVVMWNEGTLTRALAVWRKNDNGGSERLFSASYSSATNTWSTAAAVTGASPNTGGFPGFDLAVTPAGKAFLAYDDGNDKLWAMVWEAGIWSAATTLLSTNLADKLRIDVEAAANGTAIVLVGNSKGAFQDSVYAISYEGTAWQTPVQIGNLTDIDTLVPDAFGTGYHYQTVADLRLAVDAEGNALAVFVPQANMSSGSGGIPIGVASYRPAGGAWTAYAPFTSVASDTDFELIDQMSSAGARAELGVSLVNGRGVVTYPVAPSSRPAGSGQQQLFVRRFSVDIKAWSARTLVDLHVGQKQGHSRALLEADGSGMIVYESFPVGSIAAGSVNARKLGAP